LKRFQTNFKEIHKIFKMFKFVVSFSAAGSGSGSRLRIRIRIRIQGPVESGSNPDPDPDPQLCRKESEYGKKSGYGKNPDQERIPISKKSGSGNNLNLER